MNFALRKSPWQRRQQLLPSPPCPAMAALVVPRHPNHRTSNRRCLPLGAAASPAASAAASATRAAAETLPLGAPQVSPQDMAALGAHMAARPVLFPLRRQPLQPMDRRHLHVAWSTGPGTSTGPSASSSASSGLLCRPARAIGWPMGCSTSLRCTSMSSGAPQEPF